MQLTPPAHFSYCYEDNVNNSTDILAELVLVRYNVYNYSASQKWGITERRIQKLCEEGRIHGVIRFRKVWAIPKVAVKPTDGRLEENRNGGSNG